MFHKAVGRPMSRFKQGLAHRQQRGARSFHRVKGPAGETGSPRKGTQDRGHSYGSKSCTETCRWKETREETAQVTSAAYFHLVVPRRPAKAM